MSAWNFSKLSNRFQDINNNPHCQTFETHVGYDLVELIWFNSIEKTAWLSVKKYSLSYVETLSILAMTNTLHDLIWWSIKSLTLFKLFGFMTPVFAFVNSVTLQSRILWPGEWFIWEEALKVSPSYVRISFYMSHSF